MVLKCVVVDDDKSQRNLIENYIEEIDFLHLSATFDNAISAINFLNINSVDIIFLDIEMPQMTGFEFLESIKNAPQIIIMSSQEGYALKSYNYTLTDYLLKPVSYTRFIQAVNKARNTKTDKNFDNEKELFVKVNSIIEKIELKDILFIEAAVDYVKIHTSKGRLLVNTSMNNMLEKLPKHNFIRIHRSYIINKKEIVKIDGNFIKIKDTLLPISKSHREAVMHSITII